jgi:REP element-mobilizing transposase RayT
MRSLVSLLTCCCSCTTCILDIPANNHRRQWIEDKMLELASIFAIDLCAYAVMSNHYHVVLFIDKVCADNLSKSEFIERWPQLFAGNTYSQRFIKKERLNSVEEANLDRFVDQWRERLMAISWFMRIFNESVARKANKEDKCTGRFWEGRFFSQALPDEKALAACAAYVDLNPIRAGLSKSIPGSEYTSIKRRCEKAEEVS